MTERSVEFSHYLGTRFNVPNSEWTKTRDGKSIDEIWLKNRIELFKNYCLPSVLNQSNKNFEWIIFADVNTLDAYKEEIISLCNWEFIHILWVSDFKEIEPSFLDYIQSKTESGFVITTRIDNDDLVHKNFIDQIQKQFRPEHQIAIDFPNGFQMNLKNNLVYKHTARSNHFISLIASIQSLNETVYSRDHTTWKHRVKVTSPKKRLWVELVHDDNMANTISDSIWKRRLLNYHNYGIKSGD
ncbi:MAG: hypothetical protein JXQ90_21515 [Cyclobacteriaceae bacterium]